MLETERLRLRRLDHGDADFIVELLNEPSFLRFIGDKGVRTREDALRYLDTGPLASYQKHGFGLYGVALRESGELLGICGLIRRDTLPDVDVGFAFVPRAWSQGYAMEAARATLREGWEAFDLKRIVAITSPDNVASIRLLERLGFRYEGLIRLTPEAPEVKLFGCEVSPAAA